MDPNDLPPRSAKLDISLPHLLPERVVHLSALGIDEHALRIRYEVTPPLEPGGYSMEGWLARNHWYISARDDRGNLYEDGGGGAGLSADGMRTEGVHSLLELPPADTSWLEIAFHRADDAVSMDHPAHVVRLKMPLEVILIHPPDEWP